MNDEARIDALRVLEEIRSQDFSDKVTEELLRKVYDVEHDAQFEDERGSVQASLRDLIVESEEDIS